MFNNQMDPYFDLKKCGGKYRQFYKVSSVLVLQYLVEFTVRSPLRLFADRHENSLLTTNEKYSNGFYIL